MQSSAKLIDREPLRPEAKARLAWRVNDACSALGISRSHIYDLAANGKIRLIKIGSRTVVPDDEVQRIAREGA
jgi:excisionase family DNA binding protein